MLGAFQFCIDMPKINWILTFKTKRALIRNFGWKSARNLIDFRPEIALDIVNVAQGAKNLPKFM